MKEKITVKNATRVGFAAVGFGGLLAGGISCSCDNGDNPAIVEPAQTNPTAEQLAIEYGDSVVVNPGESVAPRGRFVMSGDFELNNKPLYDNDEKTGLIVINRNCDSNCDPDADAIKLFAEWGGSGRDYLYATDVDVVTIQQAIETLNNPDLAIDTIFVYDIQAGEVVKTLTKAEIEATYPTIDEEAAESTNDEATQASDQTQEAIAEYGSPINIAPEDSATLSGRFVISGDVKVNGSDLYDNDPATGLIIADDCDCNEAVLIEATWGASGRTSLKEEEVELAIDRQAERTFENNPGINTIKVVNVKGEVLETISRS